MPVAGDWAFDSAGGFSAETLPQEWQRDAIEAYGKKHQSEVFGSLQNNAGVPDLSAQVRWAAKPMTEIPADVLCC